MISTLPAPLPAPTADRWQPLRLGIRNIWHYDDRVFRFYRGRLILQGRNGAGKTKVLELALPFLLDPDTTPRKLSPSESEERSMWWNLIEPQGDDSFRWPSREGWVWLEFGRRTAEGDRFFTIGARLRATSSSRTVKAVFFHTTLRVGAELDLAVAQGTGVRAANPSELRAAIGATGGVTESRTEHKEAVDAALYGLGSRYDGMIALLRTLRKPKLSEKLKLPDLKNQLSDALPPLPDDVIARQAEVFDGLRQDEAELAEAKAARDRVARFLRTYEGYARRAAAQSADALRAADSHVRDVREEIRLAEGAVSRAEAAATAHAGEVEALGVELDALAGRLEAVRRSDEMREATAIALAASSADEAERRAKDDEKRATKAQHTAAVAERDAARLEGEASKEERSRDDALVAARASAETLGLGSAMPRIEAVIADEPRLRRLADDTADARRKTLRSVRAAQQAAREAARDHDGATSRAEAAATRAAAAATAEASAIEARTKAGEALEDALGGWADGLRELVLDASARRSLLDAIVSGTPSRAAAGAAARQASEALVLAADTASRDLAAASADVRSLAGEVRAVLAEPVRRPAPDPLFPASREGRPGAPFYEVVDFAPGLDAAQRAGLEAALAGAGILDAWIDPDGAIDASDRLDVAVLGTRPVTGPSLADALVVVDAGVPASRVEALLRSIGLGAGDGPAWVGVDGRFRMGERSGRSARDAAAFVGAAAREAERVREAQRLRGLLGAAWADRRSRQAAVAAVAVRQDALAAEIASVPSDRAYRDAAREANDATSARGLADEAVERAREDVERTAGAVTTAGEALTAAASAAGVPADTAIDELLDRVSDFRSAVIRLGDLSRSARAAGERAHARRREAGELAGTADSLAQTAQDERSRATRLRATADELAAGASDDARTVVARERELAAAQKEKQQAQKVLAKAGETVAARQATAAARKTTADEALQPALDARDEAAASFGRLAATGLLGLVIALGPEDGAPEAWENRTALEVRRRVNTGDREAFTPKAISEAITSVQNGLRALQAELPASDFGSSVTPDGHYTVFGRVQDEMVPIGEVLPILDADIIAREEAFREEHREAARKFLLDGAGHALSERIRAASRLVEETTIELRRHETASGRHLRLRWTPAPTMPSETTRVLAMLAKHPGDLRDEERLVIEAFLSDRIAAATAAADEIGFAPALEEALDYRRWHAFHLDRWDGHRYVELTSRNFSGGSEGERAAELHLPLFAAASSFYNSGRPGAPRLVMLDEAFSGIDDDMRAEMFGITAAFDLDLVITSPDEWGTYPTVSGVSIYLLQREKDGGPRGVLARRFVWTGREKLSDREAVAAGVG